MNQVQQPEVDAAGADTGTQAVEGTEISTDATPVLVGEGLLVEDVSIDGMCGVY